eukprot:jgi/Mesvir1/27156/Mv20820-RA.1
MAEVLSNANLVAREGREKQRYHDGRRLVAGCIPIRVVSANAVDTSSPMEIEVLLINSRNKKGLVFPKGGWENDETAEEAAMREAMEEAGVRGYVNGSLGPFDFESRRRKKGRAHIFVLHVTEEMDAWPEMKKRSRAWYPLKEAKTLCKHSWMHEALMTCEAVGLFASAAYQQRPDVPAPLLNPAPTPTT